MNTKKFVSISMAFATMATLALAVPAFAETTTPPANQPGVLGNHFGQGKGMDRKNIKPGVFGTVSAINGNSITINGKQGFGVKAIATTFTVDATNAKITKNKTASTVSNITVGDTVMVQGTVTGTNIVATMIRDGIMQGGLGKVENMKLGQQQEALQITGNGQPVIAGTIGAVNGSTLTITNKSNVTYTVDATNAKIVPITKSISTIAVGDMVIVQGTVNGNAVVASSIIDQVNPMNTPTTTPGTATQSHKGFFGNIGSFFGHLFGF